MRHAHEKVGGTARRAHATWVEMGDYSAVVLNFGILSQSVRTIGTT
jgi:hypothetical protein